MYLIIKDINSCEMEQCPTLDIVSSLFIKILDSGYLSYWGSRYATRRFVVPLPGESTKLTDCLTASTGRRLE